jgi:hypothetical protein
MFKRQSEARTGDGTASGPAAPPIRAPWIQEKRASADKKIMNPIALNTLTPQRPAAVAPAPQAAPPAAPAEDAITVFDAIHDVLDLSAANRDPFGGYAQLQETQKTGFLKQLATLLQSGVTGIETREVNGRPYQSFVEIGMGDERLRGARPYTRNEHLDLRA